MHNANEKFKWLSEIVQNRRSVFPAQFSDQKISDELLDQILENANWAPTHKRTEPWRFHVIRNGGLERLAAYLGQRYTENPKGGVFSEAKLKKTKQKVLRSSAVLAIVMARDVNESIPEWEEIASTAMAVQNIWLSCEALDIGTYWSSPSLFTENNTFLDLEENERCLGLMYMGYYDLESKGVGIRTSIAEKIVRVDQ